MAAHESLVAVDLALTLDLIVRKIIVAIASGLFQ
jgi:hypothetical protein